MKKNKLFCTLGPSSLNSKFLKFANKEEVDLLRLNMSHVDISKLEKTISFIRNYTNIDICIDTEGAQIRTNFYGIKKFKRNEVGIISSKKKTGFKLYPDEVFNKIKLGDVLDIGFKELKVKIIQKSKKEIKFKTINPGVLESNKGVHVTNRKITMNFLTKKDFKAIEIAKKNKIKDFALSFTNNLEDLIRFNKLLPNCNKIFKIETKSAIKNFKKMLKHGNKFLIDRGDLSKDISIENIPIAQRYIISESKKISKKEVYIATNFLESMTLNTEPTRAEVNDIYSSIEIGAAGLVLAAETAIGKNPAECITFIKKIYFNFDKNQKKKLTASLILKK